MSLTRKEQTMSRYIDADKVLKELHLNHKDVIYIDKNECAKRIEKIPSIDIVRCGECKWCDDAGKKRALICTNPYIDVDPHPNFFCGYGER